MGYILEVKVQLAGSREGMGIVLVQRASPQIEFKNVEMAFWTPSHHWWSNL
jgi:hypothetical protein